MDGIARPVVRTDAPSTSSSRSKLIYRRSVSSEPIFIIRSERLEVVGISRSGACLRICRKSTARPGPPRSTFSAPLKVFRHPHFAPSGAPYEPQLSQKLSTGYARYTGVKMEAVTSCKTPDIVQKSRRWMDYGGSFGATHAPNFLREDSLCQWRRATGGGRCG